MTEPELKELDEAYAQIGIIPVGAPFVYVEHGRHEFIFTHKGKKWKLKLSEVKEKVKTLKHGK